jgi:cytochrome b
MNEIKVWDAFIRVAHWLLAAGFLVAYVSGGDPMWLHSWAGYVIAGVVLLRVIWGFVGPEHARFVNFVKSPGSVFAYLRDLIRFSARRYLGHSPAGGAMTIALLVLLLTTASLGMLDLALTRGEGPLSLWLQPDAAVTAALAAGQRVRGPFKDIHEFFANLTLAFVILHLCGVALASFAHRENLPRAMVTGRKRP